MAKDGPKKGGDIAAGAAKGGMTGAQIGTAIMPGVGTLIGAGVGALAGGIKGGKVTAAERMAYEAQKEADRVAKKPRIKADPRATAAMTRALNPNDYAAGPSPELDAAAQKAGIAAVGMSAKMANDASQAQKAAVMKNLGMAAQMENQERYIDAKEKQAEIQAAGLKEGQGMQDKQIAQLGATVDQLGQMFNFGFGP